MSRAPTAIWLFVAFSIASMAHDVAAYAWSLFPATRDPLWPIWVDQAIVVGLNSLFIWLIAARRSDPARVILLGLAMLGILAVIWMAIDPNATEPAIGNVWDGISLALGIASVVPLLTPAAVRWCRERSVRIDGVFD